MSTADNSIFLNGRLIVKDSFLCYGYSPIGPNASVNIQGEYVHNALSTGHKYFANDFCLDMLWISTGCPREIETNFRIIYFTDRKV